MAHLAWLFGQDRRQKEIGPDSVAARTGMIDPSTLMPLGKTGKRAETYEFSPFQTVGRTWVGREHRMKQAGYMLDSDLSTAELIARRDWDGLAHRLLSFAYVQRKADSGHIYELIAEFDAAA